MSYSHLDSTRFSPDLTSWESKIYLRAKTSKSILPLVQCSASLVRKQPSKFYRKNCDSWVIWAAPLKALISAKKQLSKVRMPTWKECRIHWCWTHTLSKARLRHRPNFHHYCVITLANLVSETPWSELAKTVMHDSASLKLSVIKVTLKKRWKQALPKWPKNSTSVSKTITWMGR